MKRALVGLLVVVTLAPASARADDRRAASRAAWTTFFGHTSGAIGTGLGILYDQEVDEPAAAIVWTSIGLLVGTGVMSTLAAEERWDAPLGWALSGVYGGALLGTTLGLGLAVLDGAQAGDSGFAEVAAVSAITGGVAGLLGLLGESLDGGRPGTLLGGMYAGMGVGLAAGMVGLAVSDGSEGRAAVLLSAAVGALMGLVVAEAGRGGRS